MDHFAKIKELTSVTETYSKQIQDNVEEKADSKGQMNDFRASEGWLEMKRVITSPSHDPSDMVYFVCPSIETKK